MADDAAPATLRRTPLDAEHDAAGARMVPFAGWRMPLQYEGIVAEHMAVRERAGIFDVSHMGQLVVEGAEAITALQRVLSNDLSRIAEPGLAQYTMLLDDDAGIIDDLIAYRLDPERLLLVVNAANRELDAAALAGIAVDESDGWAMFALQGPDALAVLADRTGLDARPMPPFTFTGAAIAEAACVVATTGYTGERGVELLVPADGAVDVWRLLTGDERVTRCGLGSRDTLRLEACYPLHGSDLDTARDPLAAGLGFAAPASVDDITAPAHAALRERRAAGPRERLVPIRVDGRGIPRAGMELQRPDGSAAGRVTSGTMSPVLRAGIGLAWVAADLAATGTSLSLDVRGTETPVQVAARPFVAGSPVR
ncbi:MAG: gcvT [Thermoleophilia bacterium]|nr:gcvT [Thermoleophilia bacterium]